MTVRKSSKEKQAEHVAKKYAQNVALGLCRCGREREEKRFKLCARCRKWIRERYTPKHGRFMPVAERFWSHVDKSGDCWVWTSSRNQHGYGQVHFQSRPRFAHRVSWILTNGEILNDLWVLHHCDNPPCVRPDHLFLGTPKDNSQDMVRKGRQRKGGHGHTKQQGGVL